MASCSFGTNTRRRPVSTIQTPASSCPACSITACVPITDAPRCTDHRILRDSNILWSLRSKELSFPRWPAAKAGRPVRTADLPKQLSMRSDDWQLGCCAFGCAFLFLHATFEGSEYNFGIDAVRIFPIIRMPRPRTVLSAHGSVAEVYTRALRQMARDSAQDLLNRPAPWVCRSRNDASRAFHRYCCAVQPKHAKVASCRVHAELVVAER